MRFLKSSLTRAFSAAALVLFLTGCAHNSVNIRDEIGTTTGVPLQDHFNTAALIQDTTQSCYAKENMRADNVRRHVFNSTPDAFKKKGNDLVILSPKLSDSQRREAQRLVADIPDHLQDLFYMHGGVWVFTRDSLVEALPVFGQDRYEDENGINPFYESYSGLYIDNERRLYMPFNIGDVRERTVNGETFKDIRYYPLRTNKYRTLHHEYGHFLDSILGQEYVEREHRGRTHHFVETDAFKEAFDKDMKALHDKIRRGQINTSSYSYFLPATYDGEAYGGEHTNLIRAKKELLAGVWAELMGEWSRSTNMEGNFPTVYALLEYANQTIKDNYEQRANQCDYTQDGSATSPDSSAVGALSTKSAPSRSGPMDPEADRERMRWEESQQHPTKPHIRIEPH